ncbi:MAG TPA: hypothetical protein VK523_04085 [Steroidobacteraceae bacterium]|nr:hypothetical protein [Steroidobacteraceae bacterium]
MSVSDETLMAYADGEVDAATRAIIEAAMRDDPEIRRRVEEHRALRETLQGAFSAVLDEPVPQRLIDAARGHDAARAGNVVDMASARRAAVDAPGRRRSWQPVAMAASVLVGVAVGYLGWHGSNSWVKTNSSGELIAGVGLAEALSNQLSEDRSPGLVAITGLSFRAKTGDFCRTFSVTGAHASSGLACHEADGWKIKVLAQTPAAPNSSNFRPAASGIAPAVRAVVEESIDGEPLDQAGEIAARKQGWAATPSR